MAELAEVHRERAAHRQMQPQRTPPILRTPHAVFELRPELDGGAQFGHVGAHAVVLLGHRHAGRQAHVKLEPIAREELASDPGLVHLQETPAVDEIGHGNEIGPATVRAAIKRHRDHTEAEAHLPCWQGLRMRASVGLLRVAALLLCVVCLWCFLLRLRNWPAMMRHHQRRSTMLRISWSSSTIGLVFMLLPRLPATILSKSTGCTP